VTEHCDSIECEAATSRILNPARDLDSLVHLTRRRYDGDGIVERGFLGRI